MQEECDGNRTRHFTGILCQGKIKGIETAPSLHVNLILNCVNCELAAIHKFVFMTLSILHTPHSFHRLVIPHPTSPFPVQYNFLCISTHSADPFHLLWWAKIEIEIDDATRTSFRRIKFYICSESLYFNLTTLILIPA